MRYMSITPMAAPALALPSGRTDPITPALRQWLSPQAAPVRHARPRGGAEIIQRAFAFSDIVGSTELADRLGDERYAALIGVHNEIVRSALRVRGGHLAAFLGDGYLVDFEHASQVVDWAVAVQREVRRMRATMAQPALRVRIGAHSGVALREGDDYVGRDVIVARRLCELAGPDEILVSTHLRGDVAADHSRFSVVRDVALKGIEGTQEACTVRWA